MPIVIEEINPIDDKRWDIFVDKKANKDIFITSNWARVLKESYGYIPIFFSCVEDGEIVSSLPVFQIKSILTGTRGVSVPFADFSEPVIEKKYHFDLLMQRIKEFGVENKWKYLEVRGGADFFETKTSASKFHKHTLILTNDSQNNYSNINIKTRQNINAAKNKYGLEVVIAKSLDAMYEFYNLNCLTRKKHGLPPQPLKFFKKIHEHIISEGYGFLCLSYSGNKCVAGGVYFQKGDFAIYKYSASDLTYLKMKPNHIFMWEAIKHLSDTGVKEICFGKTELINEGLRKYKIRWGADESVSNYYKYDYINNEYVKNESITKGIHNVIFNKMPLSCLKLCGEVLYKHFG